MIIDKNNYDRLYTQEGVHSAHTALCIGFYFLFFSFLLCLFVFVLLANRLILCVVIIRVVAVEIKCHLSTHLSCFVKFKLFSMLLSLQFIKNQ